MPWNPLTGTWDTGSAPGGRVDLGGAHRDAGYRSQQYVNRKLLNQEAGREATANRRAGRYEDALYDPEGTANRYADIYRKAGEAIAAPAMRDFNQTLARTGANVASRFGGNVSSEELRQGYNTSDLFSRNLGEALARLGGEQVQAGQQWTGQMGDAASQGAAERDRLEQAILQGLGMGRAQKQKKGPLDYLSAVGGAAAAFL